jgi:tRNA pseudouridine13 synthase
LTEVPEAEREVGIQAYATEGEPCAALLKKNDEDFCVEERIVAEGLVPSWKPDYFPLYRVEKRHIDTMHMERELSRILRSRLSYGGLKDKRSVSVQFVTPTTVHSERPERIDTPRFKAEIVGYLPSPLRRSLVVGNAFAVTLRGCCPQLSSRAEDAFKAGSQRRIPNFFGMQRFGRSGSGTHKVGRWLVRRDFKEAVDQIVAEPRPGDDPTVRDARAAIREGRYKEGIGLLPPSQDTERIVARSLERNPGDWVGAIRAVPLRLRRFYVQAYQSFLFNWALSMAVNSGEDISRAAPGDNWSDPKESGGLVTTQVHGVKEPASSRGIPMIQIVGYAFRDYGSRFDRLTREVMTQEGVSAKDFYISELQEVSAEGGFRRPHLALADPSCQEVGDSFRLGFTLGRGQYATVLLREVVKPRDPLTSGFA